MPRGKRTRWPVDVGAGAAEDLGRLGEVDDLDADLLEERVGVRLDLLEALGRDDLDRGELAGQVRERVQGRARRSVCRAARPRRTAGCSRSGTAIGSPRGCRRARERRATDMVRPRRIRGGGPAPVPRRTPGSRGAAPRHRRSGGTRCRGRSRSSASAVSAIGVSAMTRVSASRSVCSPVSVDGRPRHPARRDRTRS